MAQPRWSFGQGEHCSDSEFSAPQIRFVTFGCSTCVCVCVFKTKGGEQKFLSMSIESISSFSFTLLKREIPQLPGYGDIFPLPPLLGFIFPVLCFIYTFLGVNESPADRGGLGSDLTNSPAGSVFSSASFLPKILNSRLGFFMGNGK